MELQNYNQDIISTSSSEVPPNYSDQNNPSFPQKQYSDGQSQVQQQYNLPQQPYYQPQNDAYSSYSQNQYAMPILPENLNPPSNYVQPIVPVFQPPLGGELNISQVKHDRVTQPQKNLFIIFTGPYSKCALCILSFVGLLFSGISIFLFTYETEIEIMIPIIFGLIGFFGIVISISWLFVPNYSEDIILGDNSITIVKKAICCRRLISSYQKNDLSGAEFAIRTGERKVRTKRSSRIVTFKIYELFLIFKNGQKEIILGGEDFYNDEFNFLAYYINNYINDQIIL